MLRPTVKTKRTPHVRQTRKTKEDQLRKKMQETQRSSSAREMMFALEKAKRERLEATMHHFEQHMHQRELTLAEKVCGCSATVKNKVICFARKYDGTTQSNVLQKVRALVAESAKAHAVGRCPDVATCSGASNRRKTKHRCRQLTALSPFRATTSCFTSTPPLSPFNRLPRLVRRRRKQSSS